MDGTIVKQTPIEAEIANNKTSLESQLYEKRVILKGGHSPVIGENGNWLEWDNEAQKMIDTGVRAEGKDYIITESDKTEIRGDIAADVDSLKSDIVNRANTITEKMEHVQKVVSKNICKGLISGGYITDKGVFYEDADANPYHYSEKINVEGLQGKYIYFTRYNGSSVVNAYVRFITAYDKDGNVLADKGSSSSVTNYIVPDGVTDIIVSVIYANADNFMVLNTQFYPTSYEPYNAEDYYKATDDFLPSDIIKTVSMVSDFTNIKKANNRLVGNNQGYVAENGVSYIDDTLWHTDKIAVASGDKITSYKFVYDYASTAFMRFIAAYDKDGNVIADKGSSSSVTNYIVPDGVTDIIISYRNTEAVHDNTMVVIGDYSPLWYEEPSPDSLEVINKALSFTKDIPIVFLPTEIYVATGRTIEIYNNQICINANRFHFMWSCSVGYQYERKYQLVGTSALEGNEYTLNLRLYNDEMECVFEETTTVKFVSELNSSKNILPIGDSLSNGKSWLAECHNLNSNVVFVGSKTTENVKDASGNISTVNHEGRSGFKAEDYIKGNPYTAVGDTSESVHNKYWDAENSRFSPLYFSNQTGISFDAIQIMLGTNGAAYRNESNANYIKQMIDEIRTDYPNIPILLCYTPFIGNQNAIGSEQYYGSSDGFTNSISGWCSYKKDMEIYHLCTKLYEALKDYTNICFVPIAQCFDREYNFGSRQVPVNPRSSIMETIGEGAVHPRTPDGYYQMADILYSAYCYMLNK